MSDAERPGQPVTEPASGKRAHARVRVRVRARTSGDGAVPRTVEIRDVGLGGMFVAARVRSEEEEPPHAPLAANDGRVHLQYLLDGNDVVQRVAGRIARINSRGFGINFDGAFVEQATALLESVGAGNAARARPEAHSRARALLADIEEAVSMWLPHRAAVFAEKAEHRLLSRAGGSLSNAQQAPFYDAIAELKRRSGDLDLVMADVLQTRLEHLGEPIVPAEEGSDVEPTPLSLVDKDEFEMFLSVADMASKAESRHDQSLYKLNRYLSVLARDAIDNANNPLAPSALCDPFHETMRDAPVPTEALTIIYESFEDAVVQELDGLYDRLLEIFDRSGIDLSEAPPPKPKSKPGRERSSGAATRDEGPETEAPAQDEAMLEVPGAPMPGDTASGPPGWDPRLGVVPGAVPGAGASPLEQAAARLPAAQQTPATQEMPLPPGYVAVPADQVPAPAVPDPFAQAPGLGFPDLDLPPGQHTADGEAGSAAAGEALVPQPAAPLTPDALVPDAVPGFLGMPMGAAAPVAAAGATMQPRQFAPRIVQPMANYAMPRPARGTAFGAVHALLGLRGPANSAPLPRAVPVDPADGTISSAAALDLLSRIQQQVAHAGGTFGAGVREVFGLGEELGPSRLGELGDAVAITGALCEAMREDPEVSEALAARLEQLEPSVHKVVVLDPGFLEQADHVARQVLNQLARLLPELASAPDDKPNGDRDEGFWAEVDALLEPLVERFDRDMSLFDAVLAELDLLLKQQQDIYQTNLTQVVEACEAQARFIRERRQASTQTLQRQAAADGEREVSREWSVWLRRAARLERGEAIEFRRGEQRERCRVAWIDIDAASFVLVNPRGEKAHTLSQQELAMQLRRGTAAIVRDFDQPLVDRALGRVLQKVHGTVERQVTHDSESGLLNRRAFTARVKQALSQNAEDGDGVAIVHMTIDEYDDIYENYGGDAAQLLMRRIERRLAAAVGEDAALAVLSPGAVAALMVDTTVDASTELAERVCAQVNRMNVRWADKPLKITARVGVVLAPPGDDVDAVLTAAERVVADSTDGSDSERVRTDVRIEAGAPSMMDYVGLINNTLGTDEMQLRCQRVQPLETGRRARPYFEVLLGVRDEQQRAVSAGEFIRAAQHYEQMPKLDKWVMRTAFRWMAEHRRWLRHVAGFAINLSPTALQLDNLTEYVLELFNETGVPPGKVIFEVTEAAAVQEAGPAQNFLRTLSEVGCQFALDDFGANEGSYTYLKQLPVAYVKIDGQFTRDLADEANLAVLQSLCEVARFMGKKTVAEQVETVPALHALTAVGVNFVQGFCIEEPCYVESLDEDSLKAIPAPVEQALAQKTADTLSTVTGNAIEHTLSF